MKSLQTWGLAALISVAFGALAPTAAAREDVSSGSTFITLGTMGGPVAEADRSQPANLLVSGKALWFVDVGDGAVQQMARAGYHLPQVRGVFISHLHFDHIGGLSALIGLRHQANAPGVLDIYGPPGTRVLVDGLLQSMAPSTEAGFGIPGARRIDPATTVMVHELRDGSAIEIGGMKVRTVKNSHYSFEPGSEADAKFASLSYRFDLPDRSILYTGDTGPSRGVEQLGKGVDLLITEMIDVPATVAAVERINPSLSQDHRDSMRRHLSAHHVSPTQVGEMAKAMGARKVVATHLVVARAEQNRLDAYVAEIKRLFDGEVVIAKDLDRF